uniref:C2H2-type domain-containing protein n=1 Tax=Anopheles christyi TaxID=43041 RepID=A0A182JR61_9DIPT
MSTEALGDTENASSETVHDRGAICKDVNENIRHCFAEDVSLADNVPPSYMQAITSLTLNSTIRGPKFYCFDCDYYLHTRLSMNTHMKMHRKPFCPICFRTFVEDHEASAHTAEFHPVFFPAATTTLIALDEPIVVKEEHPLFQTEAPPNSPTHEYKGLSELDYGFVNNNNNSIPFLLAEKLRDHQAMMNLGVRSRKQLDTTLLQCNSLDETETRGVIKSRGNCRSGMRNRRLSIAGVTGKVHKPGNKPKSTPSTPKSGNSLRGESVDSADNAMKRITSRFGRSISLKVPQF